MSKLDDLSPQKKKQVYILTPFLALASLMLVFGIVGDTPETADPVNNPEDNIDVVGGESGFGNITDEGGETSVLVEISSGENSTSMRSSRFQQDNIESVLVDADRFNEQNNASVTVYVTSLYYGETNSTQYELLEGSNTYELPELNDDKKSPLAYYLDFSLTRENPETASPRVLDFSFQ